jgi:hypothetical protein
MSPDGYAAYIPTGENTHQFDKTTMNEAFGPALQRDPETTISTVSHAGASGHYSVRIPYCHYAFDAGTQYAKTGKMEGVTIDATTTNQSYGLVTEMYGNNATQEYDSGGFPTGWMGDVCAFLTNGAWRLPTAYEFGNAENSWSASVPGSWSKLYGHKNGYGDDDIFKNLSYDNKPGTPAGSITLNNKNNANLKFPASGRLSYAPAIPGGGTDGYAKHAVSGEGTYGAYQTSSLYNSPTNGGWYYYFTINSQKGLSSARPTDAMPVRCVKK